ncbi:MAG: 16S rRNA (adenine(1518)-N(6)/adenine(1519)-N(6))-dimethyltransferase RsmA [candidate division KSB1 bacterium]|nr:16S rRNA (adenine(1518)-N(6)/adenine(1519)-N(6))-dimethyltransferase RsmA [candidate division KSB1 bacterium]
MNIPPDFSPKKSLGQNFLIDENIARKMIRLFDPQPEDLVIEIGPGFGVLTKYIVPTGCRYVGIEIDERLVPPLRKAFAAFPNGEIRHADFREVNLTELAAGKKMRIIGNIPYHITSSLVFAAFEHRAILSDMMLTVQKEVAKRIVAPPDHKDYGILSVVSQTFARAEIVFHRSKNVFRPRPEVDSAVVRWIFGPPPENLIDTAFYLKMIKAIFNQRRKTLRRSLAAFLPTNILAALPVDLQRRPESLSIPELIRLANALTSTRTD